MKTVEKALSLVNLVASENRGWGVTELSRAVGIDKAIVYRLLKTLTAGRWVEKDLSTKLYRLGPAIGELARRGSFRDRLVEIAQPVVEALSISTQETAFVTFRDGLEVVVAVSAESPLMVRVGSVVGHRAPLYCSATGKSFLAFEAPTLLELAIERGLSPRSKGTITDSRQLRAAIVQTAKRGWSEENEEFHDDVRGVAAPIMSGPTVAAAIAIRAPTARIKQGDLARLAEQVRTAAATISKQIAWGGGR